MTPTYELAKMWFTPIRESRFWGKVDKRPNGCWLWTGSLTDSGHGRYDFDGDTVRMHGSLGSWRVSMTSLTIWSSAT